MNIGGKIKNNLAYVVLTFLFMSIPFTWHLCESITVRPIQDQKQAILKQYEELKSKSEEYESIIRLQRSTIEKLNKKVEEDSMFISKWVQKRGNLPHNQLTGYAVLQNPDTLFRVIRGKHYTDLQKDNIIKKLEGQKVLWDVHVIGVSKPSLFENKIDLYLTHDLDTNKLDRLEVTVAKFDTSYDKVLGLLKVGQKIKVSGTIENLFLFPTLKECDIITSL